MDKANIVERNNQQRQKLESALKENDQAYMNHNEQSMKEMK